MIVQTRFGRLLCWLGLHLIVVGQMQNRHDGMPGSLTGGCIRCNRTFGWDF